MMIRGIISSVQSIAGKLARVSASGRAGEMLRSRPLYQNYGTASNPLPGANCIMLTEGDLILAVAADDARYRIALESGQVAVYDASGTKILLDNAGSVHITASGSVTVSAPSVALGGSAGKPLVTADLLSLLGTHTHSAPDTPSTQLATISTMQTSTTKAT